jgi:hypothetical protein
MKSLLKPSSLRRFNLASRRLRNLNKVAPPAKLEGKPGLVEGCLRRVFCRHWAVGAAALTLLSAVSSGCRSRKGLLPRGEGEAVELIQPDADIAKGVQGGAPASTELEPNNSFAQAQRGFLAPWPLDPGAPMGDQPEGATATATWSVLGQQAGATDVDVYRLILVPPGGYPLGSPAAPDAGVDGGSGVGSTSIASLSIDLVSDESDGQPLAGGLALEVRSANGTRIMQQSGTADGIHLPNMGLLVGADLQLVVTRPKRNISKGPDVASASVVPYRLYVTASAPQEGEETEPNSEPIHATAVATSTATVEAVGYLGWKQDTDWFAFSFPGMPSDSVLSIDLDLPTDGSGTLNVATDSGGKSLHGYQRSASGRLSLRSIAVPVTGALWVRVQNSGMPIVAQKYRLTISAVHLTEGSEIEPNGATDRAVETSASTVTGFVHPAGDTDTFKLCGHADMAWSVESPVHMDLEVSLLGVGGENVSTSLASAGRRTAFPPLPGGDCVVIKVQEKSGKIANLLDSYTIRLGQ